MGLALLREGLDVYGVDASESGVRVAKFSAPDRFFIMNFSEGLLPPSLEDTKFRTIVCTEVIGHLYNPRALLGLCRRILAANGGGRLIISTPYHGYLKNLALAATGRLDAHFCVLWDGGVIKFFSQKTLTEMLTEEGFRVTLFSGAGRFRWFWKSMVICAEI
jgi:2-polyprenyl-3-methyl-5-hydroxy-6-metoxy-1,4-benzoquinol methylase